MNLQVQLLLLLLLQVKIVCGRNLLDSYAGLLGRTVTRVRGLWFWVWGLGFGG